jgi:hypothetical protein
MYTALAAVYGTGRTTGMHKRTLLRMSTQSFVTNTLHLSVLYSKCSGACPLYAADAVAYIILSTYKAKH